MLKLGNTAEVNMPKLAEYRVIWSGSEAVYRLHYPDGRTEKITEEAGNLQVWSEWLQNCHSFAFEGQNGRLNLLKEGRGNDNYWYAYRRQGQRTAKKYAGRNHQLSLAHLEELAQVLELSGLPSTNQNDAKRAKSTSQKDNLVPQKNLAKFDFPPLLAPKLSLPRLHTDLIQRPRLLSWLDSVLERKLTIVSAPAGFGKTSLVRQWIEASRNSRPNQAVPAAFPAVGWLSLDANDNDPGRFWRYLIAVCQTIDPRLGQESLAALQAFAQSPFEVQSWETILVALLNELAHLKEGGILVLEDFHTITASYLYQFHMIIISRTDPRLPLARWRALNELGELGRNDLRFQPAEAKLFLEQNLQLALPVGAVTALDQKLEGWAAGLRLVTLALQRRVSTQEVLAYLEDFEITNQHTILEFFVNEVLNAQLPHLQDFLMRTSLLERLTGSLCQAVTGQAASDKLLDQLARANLFLEVSDQKNQWYRYHALFAEAMQHEARHRLGPAVVLEVLDKASHWYEEHAQLEDAVETALAGQQWRRAANLIEQIITSHPRGGMTPVEIYTLRRWLEQLPRPVLNEHPVLILNNALALLFMAMSEPVSPLTTNSILQLLDMAETAFKASNNLARLGEVTGFRALLATQRGDTLQAVAYAKQALQWLAPDELVWRSWSLGVLGGETYWEGDLNTARDLLLKARAIGELEGNRFYLRANAGMLSGVYGASGELQQAAFYINSSLKEAREEGDRDDVAHAQIGLAQLSYEWNRLEEGYQQAQEALELARLFADDEIEVEAILMLAAIQIAWGQTEAGLERLSRLLTKLQPVLSPLLYRLYHQARASQARLYLLAGEYQAAEQWRQSRATGESNKLPRLQYIREEILAARIRLAGHENEAAQAALQTLLATTQAKGQGRNHLEIQLLMALSYAETGQPEKAINLIREAANFARPQGYVRLFVDLGPAMEKLLALVVKKLNGEKTTATYLRKLLGAFDRPHRPAYPDSNSRRQVEPLSRREEKVLRLVAAGQTNPQIAQELVVSVNTVRSQIQSIYRKLDVNNRQAATEVARRLHLL
jgi:LuxR family maltose regulon positive regulatory protein